MTKYSPSPSSLDQLEVAIMNVQAAICDLERAMSMLDPDEASSRAQLQDKYTQALAHLMVLHRQFDTAFEAHCRLS